MEQKPKRKRNNPPLDKKDKKCTKCGKRTNRIYCVECKEFTITGQRLVDYLIKETKRVCDHTEVIPMGVHFVCMGCRKKVKPYGGWRPI